MLLLEYYRWHPLIYLLIIGHVSFAANSFKALLYILISQMRLESNGAVIHFNRDSSGLLLTQWNSFTACPEPEELSETVTIQSQWLLTYNLEMKSTYWFSSSCFQVQQEGISVLQGWFFPWKPADKWKKTNPSVSYSNSKIRGPKATK